MILPAAQITEQGVSRYCLGSNAAKLEVFTTGAAIHHYHVSFADGQIFMPFAEANWSGKYGQSVRNVPRHLQLIGGEFPCVPFGSTHFDAAHHGYCVDQDWDVTEVEDDRIVLEIEYPEGHVVEKLQRVISVEADTGALNISLRIEPKISCQIPIGLHPIFKLPTGSDDFCVKPPNYRAGGSAPWHLSGGFDRYLRKAETVGRKDRVWNNIHDLHNDLIQIWHVKDGHIKLEYGYENIAVDLEWNKDHFPHCLFWAANPGLSNCGMDGNFTGLGVEPTHSFFDKNDHASNFQFMHNLDVDQFGVPLIAGQVWETQYRISCKQLNNDLSRN